jgi:hypothetical protein
MPKLNGTHIASRLAIRLDELLEDKEVAARDLRKLLTDEQAMAMDAAWREQQALRKMKRTRTKQEQAELGWKSKREIQIQTIKNAIAAAEDTMLETIERLQWKATVRQAQIFLGTYSKAREEGKTDGVARNFANNELTRAGLNRTDGSLMRNNNKRDKEVKDMEEQLRARIQSEMTPAQLEQIEIKEDYEKAMRKKKNISQTD